MWAVFRFHLLQIWRSRLVLLWVLFSLFVQYSAVRILHAMSIRYQAAEVTLGMSEVVVALTYIQFFTGSILATVYGIWVVPYLHEETRAPLTFALPVNKAVFPAVYAASFLLLYFLQAITMFASLTLQFGFSIWASPQFPWAHLGSGALLSVASLEVMLFLLAVTSLYFGRISAFIGGTTVVMILQASGVIFRTWDVQEGVWRQVYKVLPPIGEVLVDMKDVLVLYGPGGRHLLLFSVWLLILGAVFRLRLNRA